MDERCYHKSYLERKNVVCSHKCLGGKKLKTFSVEGVQQRSRLIHKRTLSEEEILTGRTLFSVAHWHSQEFKCILTRVFYEQRKTDLVRTIVNCRSIVEL